MAEMHQRPMSFLELFEFMRFRKTKGIMKETAMEMIRQTQGKENG